MARPLHVSFLAFANSVPRSLHLMALLGIASIVILWRLARRIEILDGQNQVTWAPEFAALLLALSPAQAFHSRVLLAEIDAVCFLLLALLLRLEPLSPRRSYGTGLCLGLALVTQSRMSMLIPLILVWDLIEHRSLSRFLRLAGGLAMPVATMEACYAVLGIAAQAGGWLDRPMTYFEQFIHRGLTDRGVIRFNHPWFAARYLWIVESPAAAILALAGALLAFTRRHRRLAFVAAFALWIMGVASWFDQVHHQGFRWGRTVAPAVPLACLLAGVALERLRRLGRAGTILALLACASIVLARWETLAELTAMRSDQGAVLQEAARRAPARHYFSEDPLHIPLYLGPGRLPPSFLPRADTITVVLFNPPFARNYGFYYLLPDTPAFTIRNRRHRPSRLQALETVGDADFIAVQPVVPDAQVFVLAPAETAATPVRRIF